MSDLADVPPGALGSLCVGSLTVFDSLIGILSSSPWTYAIVFASIAGSAVFPLLPSESMIVTAGVLAGAGRLSLPLVLLAGALGSFVGDNLGYLVGRVLGLTAVRRVLRGERGQASLEWAQRTVDRGGGPLVVADRFIPGGQTAISIAAGTLAYPLPKYLLFAGMGAMVWSVYGSLVGVLGGRSFQQSVWKGVLFALGIALAVGGGVELVRRLQARRTRTMGPGTSRWS